MKGEKDDELSQEAKCRCNNTYEKEQKAFPSTIQFGSRCIYIYIREKIEVQKAPSQLTLLTLVSSLF